MGEKEKKCGEKEIFTVPRGKVLFLEMGGGANIYIYICFNNITMFIFMNIS